MNMLVEIQKPQKIRQILPSYFPMTFSEDVSNWINEVERLFKQPIKNVFPYPMDVIKIFDKETGKLKKLVFQVALAGISKDGIKVQIKNKKFLCISVIKDVPKENNLEIEEYVTKGISYRDSEITFRIIPEIDTDKFKPVFKDGLLSITLFVKEFQKDSDVINAVIE